MGRICILGILDYRKFINEKSVVVRRGKGVGLYLDKAHEDLSRNVHSLNGEESNV